MLLVSGGKFAVVTNFFDGSPGIGFNVSGSTLDRSQNYLGHLNGTCTLSDYFTKSLNLTFKAGLLENLKHFRGCLVCQTSSSADYWFWITNLSNQS